LSPVVYQSRGGKVNYAAVVFGSSPSDAGFAKKAGLAFLRALRTFIQGVAAALVSAFPGQAFFDTTYWKAFGFSILAAGITAVASFLNNVAGFLPDDPTQQDPPPE
jgi:hypothetical protein